MIELHDIAIHAGRFRLDGINLCVEAGQYAVLMGRTGFGKTTLLEIICGLRCPAAGRVRINGFDVTTWPPGDRRVGYLPQDLALFPTLNVRQHLQFAPSLQRASAAKKLKQTEELSALLGISHLLDRRVQNLSGGESQRVALGRALAARPLVLLLDEPLSALDEATRLEMHALLRDVKRSTGVTTLHVTHNVSEADALADRRFVLENGRLSEKRKPADPRTSDGDANPVNVPPDEPGAARNSSFVTDE